VADRDAWVARFRDQYKQIPNYVPAYAYDTGGLIVQAYQKASNVSKAAIIAQMPYNGITGKITVDPDGDLNTRLEIVKVNADGKVMALQ